MPDINYYRVSAQLLFRILTAEARTLPQLYVLGAPKSGTTALYDLMSRHPNFAAPFCDIKELSFLQDIKNFDKYEFTGTLKVFFRLLYGTYTGPRSYRKFFPLKKEMEDIVRKTGYKAITGDFSPTSLYCPIAMERIVQQSPEAKLIIMLRNPVDRAYSEYNMFFERTTVERRTFEKAIEDELRHVSLGNYLLETYLQRSTYEPFVRAYFQRFHRSQILIIKSEDFFTRPAESFGRVLKFLGLPTEGRTIARSNFEKNETTYKRPLKEKTKGFLYDYFRPHNQQLYELLGSDLEWNEP